MDAAASSFKAFGTVSHSSLVVKLVEVWTGWVNYMVGEKLADAGAV